MQFTQSDEYPDCAAYLENDLTRLIEAAPHIWQAFLEVCESEYLAHQAITFGSPPLVYIGPVQEGNLGEFRGRKGGSPNVVWIHPDVAQEYEDSPGHVGLFGRLVLHEMVHWARYHWGKPSDFNGQEAGVAFEEKAYYDRLICDITYFGCE